MKYVNCTHKVIAMMFVIIPDIFSKVDYNKLRHLSKGTASLMTDLMTLPGGRYFNLRIGNNSSNVLPL